MDLTEIEVLDDVCEQDKRMTLIYMPSSKKPLAPKSDKRSNSLDLHRLDFARIFISHGQGNLYSDSLCKNSYLYSRMDLMIYSKVKGRELYFCCVCKDYTEHDDNYLGLVSHVFGWLHMRHLSILQNKTNLSIEYINMFNIINCDVMLAQNSISIKTNKMGYCHACRFLLKTCNIRHHLHSEYHISRQKKFQKNVDDGQKKIADYKKDIWYYTQFFNCTLCEQEFYAEMNFLDHLKSDAHCSKEWNFKAVGGELDFLTCFACVTGFYGDRKKYYEHNDNFLHKHCLRNGDYTVSEMMPHLLCSLNKIEHERQRLIEDSNTVMLENKQSEILRYVEKVVECKYPKAKAYIFGSRYSHTALSNSDLDIFLDCDNIKNKDFNAALNLKHLRDVRKCFENNEDEWYIEEVLINARIPIIKVRHYPTDLKCDISFSNGLARKKSKLVRYYNDAYPMCRELILYLKKWMTYSQLSGTEGISTFSVSWLVIFYLQHKGVFPSVYDLLRTQTRSKIIDGWECGYQKNIRIKSNNSNFVEHLVGFFEFYAKFDYQKDVICPYLGLIIEKEKFATMQLPQSLISIVSEKNKKALSLFRFDSPMCMQDPTDLSQNSTKALRKRQLRCFREYCSESAKIILESQK